MSARLRPKSLAPEQVARSVDWIAQHQRSDGAIPWFPGGRMDPWDHVQCAMALTCRGRFAAARAGYRYLARAQAPDGTWPAASAAGTVLDSTRQTNHAAYLATGLWYYYRARDDRDFLAEMWSTLDRAIRFVVRLQDSSGAIAWAADAGGAVWQAPLVTGCSSIHGSLLCAVRIAATLGHERPKWERARRRLARALRTEHDVFRNAPLPTPPGHHSMDWYYPVLGGAVRGAAGRHRLHRGKQTYIDEGAGCRCVIDRPWYTVAETCELVLALDACGLSDRARDLFEWVQTLREGDGGYWTGIAYPEMLLWPIERPSWTAATVVLAADALGRDSVTSGFFRDLEPEEEHESARPAIAMTSLGIGVA